MLLPGRARSAPTAPPAPADPVSSSSSFFVVSSASWSLPHQEPSSASDGPHSGGLICLSLSVSPFVLYRRPSFLHGLHAKAFTDQQLSFFFSSLQNCSCHRILVFLVCIIISVFSLISSNLAFLFFSSLFSLAFLPLLASWRWCIQPV